MNTPAPTTLSPDQVSLVRAVLREIASRSDPPLRPSELIYGRGCLNTYHIARLRGIAGLRLKAAGLKMVQIAEIFWQPWVTTFNQCKTAPKLSGNPRYQQFFRP